MGASAEATIATNKQNKRTTLSARETHRRATVVTFFLHAQRTNDLWDRRTICPMDQRFVGRTNHMSHGWTICWTEEGNQMKDMDEKCLPLWGRYFYLVNFLLGN
jgi:hypothetical protein